MRERAVANLSYADAPVEIHRYQGQISILDQLLKLKANVINDTKQTEFENLLDEKLGNIWPLWNKRDIFRGELFGKLYLLRNSIFGIKATTTRKMIKGNYVKKNLNKHISF